MNKEDLQKILEELSSRAQLLQRLHTHAKRLINQALMFTSWARSFERIKKLANQ